MSSVTWFPPFSFPRLTIYNAKKSFQIRPGSTNFEEFLSILRFLMSNARQGGWCNGHIIPLIGPDVKSRSHSCLIRAKSALHLAWLSFSPPPEAQPQRRSQATVMLPQPVLQPAFTEDEGRKINGLLDTSAGLGYTYQRASLVWRGVHHRHPGAARDLQRVPEGVGRWPARGQRPRTGFVLRNLDSRWLRPARSTSTCTVGCTCYLFGDVV